VLPSARGLHADKFAHRTPRRANRGRALDAVDRRDFAAAASRWRSTLQLSDASDTTARCVMPGRPSWRRSECDETRWALDRGAVAACLCDCLYRCSLRHCRSVHTASKGSFSDTNLRLEAGVRADAKKLLEVLTSEVNRERRVRLWTSGHLSEALDGALSAAVVTVPPSATPGTLAFAFRGNTRLGHSEGTFEA